MPHPSLAQLQGWFQAVMTSPDPFEVAIDVARDVHRVDEMTLRIPPGEASSAPGLQIYARGYWLRLMECLRADYPALRAVLGEKLFDFFARSYLHLHPSSSPTLYDLGAGLADFLAETQPKDAAEADRAPLRLALDLARLERARTEVLRAEGIEGLPVAINLELVSYLKTCDQIVRSAPCLRVLSLSFPLIALLQAIDQHRDDVEIPDPRPTIIALSRMHYRLQLVELEPWQSHFLEATKSLNSIHACARSCAEIAGEPTDWILARLFVWLPDAIRRGLLILDECPQSPATAL